MKKPKSKLGTYLSLIFAGIIIIGTIFAIINNPMKGNPYVEPDYFNYRLFVVLGIYAIFLIIVYFIGSGIEKIYNKYKNNKTKSN